MRCHLMIRSNTFLTFQFETYYGYFTRIKVSDKREKKTNDGRKIKMIAFKSLLNKIISIYFVSRVSEHCVICINYSPLHENLYRKSFVI